MFALKSWSWVAVVAGLQLALMPVYAVDTNKEEGRFSGANWTKGPAKASLKGIAEVQVPEGYVLADAKSTRKMLEAMGNPTSGTELGFLAPTSMVWFVVFRFNDTGYVKDDEKDKLDAAEMLDSIKRGTERANERRKEMGAAPLTVVGWEQPPKYNSETHNLEWAIRGETEGRQVINYNTRLLGRKGVMEVKLVIAPEKLEATIPAYQAILQGYSFQQGQTYAEYRSGDKIAKYGLAALVTGGAAVVAVKTGLFAYILLFAKKAWKLVAVGVAAVASFFKRLINGGRKPRAE